MINARKCPDPPVGSQTAPGRALTIVAFPRRRRATPHKGSARDRAPFGTPRAAQYDSLRKSYLQEPDRTLR